MFAHRPVVAAAGAAIVILAAACAGPEPSPPEPSGPAPPAAQDAGALRPVALPDLARLEASVQVQIRDRFTRLERLRAATAPPASDLAQAYGEVGRHLLAAEFVELAEPYFLNARALAPREYRWPYYLGHVYRMRGMLPDAARAFEQALDARPDDIAALVWLGELHLTAGRFDAAGPLFARALAVAPTTVAARFGAGRAALAQQDYRAAVEHFEAALALDKQAVNIHYPLAMAYRGLGDTAKVEAHLRRQGKFEILPPDPLMQEVRLLLRSAISHEIQGTRELNSGHWTEAAAEFRKGLEIDPTNPSLRHKLGTALYMLGQPDAARQLFEQVVRESPGYAKAQYSLGVMLESNGRRAEALERYLAAVREEPGYLEARVRLAGLLRVLGRPREALAHYDEVLAADSRVPEALFGSAMAYVRLGRYGEARDRLREARQRHPDQPGFAHALARVLAASPDERVRDAREALAIMDALPDAQRRLDFGETMAMALAAAGRHADAAAWQREAVAAARRAGNGPLAARMAETLALYEAGQPPRAPWRDEDLP